MIYLDHNATTPLCPEARDALRVWLDAPAGNPSSPHFAGQRARAALDHARRQLALALGLRPALGEEVRVVFTSGATEADHLGLLGGAAAMQAATPAQAGASRAAGAGTVATLAIDHPALLRPAAALADRGWHAVELAHDAAGRVDVDASVAALAGAPGPWLVAVAAVHHELGVVQPVEALAETLRASARRVGVALRVHVDGAQASGRVDLAPLAACADQLVISGHKAGALAGVGALVLGHGVRLEPVVAGAQEAGLRGGSENLAGVITLGAAASTFEARMRAHAELRRWRDEAWRGVSARWPGARRHGPTAPAHETGHVLSIALPGAAAELLVMALDVEGVCVSVGAACSSGTLAPSPAITAIAGDEAAQCTIRISFGVGQGAVEVGALVEAIERVASRLGADRGR